MNHVLINGVVGEDPMYPSFAPTKTGDVKTPMKNQDYTKYVKDVFTLAATYAKLNNDDHAFSRLALCTSHSLRATAVTWACRCLGINSDAAILRWGRWAEASKVFRRYVQDGGHIFSEHARLGTRDPIFDFFPFYNPNISGHYS